MLAGTQGILFALIGLMGALRENYCLSVTYCVLCIIGLIFNLASATKVGYIWAQFVFQLLQLLGESWLGGVHARGR